MAILFKNSLEIQWRKVSILPKQKEIDKTKIMLNNLPDPYKFIQCTNKSKILARMMTADNSTTHAVADRLNKANGACGTIWKRRLIIFYALIGSILLYSLPCFQITKRNISRLRSLHSRCISGASQGIENSTPINEDVQTLTFV